MSAFYALGVAGARSVGGNLSAPQLRRAFVHSLVPIALVYVAAHYLTFLIFEGQSIAYLASDPLGEGWDLFGTASGDDRLRRAEPEPGLVPAGGLRGRRATWPR